MAKRPDNPDEMTQEQRERLLAAGKRVLALGWEPASFLEGIEGAENILRAVRELETLRVNVLGFLQQALDGERAIGNPRGDTDAAYADRVAAALRADTESSVPLFAPSLLWTLAHLRTDLWNGIESKEYQAEARQTLATIADAIADRRTGPGAPPKAGGEVQRDEERERRIALLAEIASSASETVAKATDQRDEEPAYYARLLVRLCFWEKLDASIPHDFESHRSRAMYQLHRDVFDHARRDRPSLRQVVAAMVVALLGGEVDAEIFGGDGAPDARTSPRSLATRALDKYLSGTPRIPNE